jgi:hypothetical protein
MFGDPVTRIRRSLAALLLAFAVMLGTGGAPPAVADTPAPVTLTGIDLHDGHVLKLGDTYYLYGTMYGCGFSWYQSGTPWCGFGVSTASALEGPWSTPTRLFSPSDIDPWTGTTWSIECGGTGAGCFNPRMLIRSGWGQNDGVAILWFNSPADYTRNHANAYNVMGCAGPLGPCGPNAPGGHGSYNKPSLSVCSGNGDFSLVTIPGQQPAIVCTMPTPGGYTFNVERLAFSGSNGDGYGSRALAGLVNVEGPGMWQDATTGTWVMTYSDPACGYCAGVPAGYATAPSPYGPWTAPGNVAAAGNVLYGRRDFSPSSCGGQPRTISVLDGVPWQVIDLWRGTPNEASAGLHFEPLTYRPATGTAGDGGLWRPAIAPLTCT